MTGKAGMDRARLAAFVDGELSPEEAAAVVLHLADHPEDQAYVDDLFAANTALAAAFADPVREAVPERLQRTILPVAEVVQIERFRLRPQWVVSGMAAAAAVLAAVVLFDPAPEARLAIGPVAADSVLGAMLDGAASGEAVQQGTGRGMMVLATVPVDGGYCREIELVDATRGQIELGLACLRGAAPWQIEVVLKEPLTAQVGADGYVTAEGTDLDGLTPFLDQRGAGLALSPAEEAALIADGWRE